MGQYNWQLCFSSMCNIGNGHAGTYNSNGNDGKYNNFDVGPRENHLHLGISIETCAIKHRTKIEIDCMKELVFGNDRQQKLKRTKHFGLFNSIQFLIQKVFLWNCGSPLLAPGRVSLCDDLGQGKGMYQTCSAPYSHTSHNRTWNLSQESRPVWIKFFWARR